MANAGSFKKGEKRPGQGRPVGAVNKTTKELKEMVLLALDEAGGVDYLVRQARKKNPAAFMALLGRVLPMTVAGDPENPLQTVHRIELVGVKPK
jgi:hypothetical protein